MEKLYYSISEVAEMLDVTPSNLRFWEKEFTQLRPKRNEKGTRFYSQKDIQTIKQIKYLVDEQKLTLEGARLKLSQKKDEVAKQQELLERLKGIRNELLKIIQALND
ncbi:MAG TPA: MerR family transcriptional regulator [Paludibacteraceae bacterium]|jgi:DNA-binding transcriptional MerR regulator|nr:MerR family transcriptional regulator [Paludibacteraceae bacterium]HOK36781.1 MerR family transcriptional regulator [Paludibacteraceae bacterium]HOL00835.1 MerR family transcriptional regulator [Paludibacteraceae bacterium]HOO19589.1 MerR family transcriptional regulator [Paludibacteraceae bacterium]HOV84451.1 MerR family transcriptional regulator [Paludibacteraceae bacterium]